ncbi:SAM-dependent methyltransferase [Paenibacillus qinlingensis]|uniref:SAM-dependent methyltransferase n=2 Tax=Paenibacillus qinlingensis TaxID=1837343 RepID=A0ABU1NXA1_9BACL|nr:SAM-dependent methyltransferase [Paenibacillus qinlingensis]
MDNYVSRFFTYEDTKNQDIFYSLPNHWWSRHYEYIWAAHFVEKDHVVLDAACGLGHPFKYYLVDKCKEVYACDMDERILDRDEIIKELEYYVGKANIDQINLSTLSKPNITIADISKLPYEDAKFDVAFCISVMEHIEDMSVQLRALEEFKRVLKDGGKLIITVDYPDVHVEKFLSLIDEAGLQLAGDHDFTKPANAITSDFYGRDLWCIRFVLEKNNV